MDQEEVEEKETKYPQLRERDFTWESLASVEISRQNQLISEVYNLMNSFDNERIEFIKKEWQSLSEEGIDPALEARFQEALKKYEVRFENISTAQETKKELIREAESLKDSTSWAKTTETMHRLQEQWREAGFAGQDVDQELWERFSAAKNHFFNRRSDNYKQMKQNHESSAALKETLIAEAESLKDSTEWKATSDTMRDLMERWKEAGFAGRDVDQVLWERFNAARQTFYENQKVHFDGLRAMYAKAKEEKEKLIEVAKELKDSHQFDAAREKFSELFETWKSIGSAGRKHEQKLWDEFKGYQDVFYERYKAFQQERRQDHLAMSGEEIERLEVRIQALEQLNDMIDIKIENLSTMQTGAEDEAKHSELETLKQNKEDNNSKLDAYYKELETLKRNAE